jgi:1-acyl-sn-glycerol-3-phosphate acyltransferase
MADDRSVSGDPVAEAPRPLGPSPFVYAMVRVALRLTVGAYVRVRVEGAERIPPRGAYLLCFNHPSWLDPVVLAAAWPDRTRRLFIFGPREHDMTRGWRNHLITWTGRGVPFKPGGADALDATRRAVAVLRAGEVLAVAGEGRLSDHENMPLPLEPGVGHFAMLARVPIVPVAIIGTRWVHLGKRIALRVGEVVEPSSFGGGRSGAVRIGEAIHAELVRLLEGVVDSDPPGRFGAWLSELYNDRPWLETTRPPNSG